MNVLRDYQDEGTLIENPLGQIEEKPVQIEENKNSNVGKFVNLLGYDTSRMTNKDMTIIKDYVKFTVTNNH